jgi:hypothetical protein
MDRNLLIVGVLWMCLPAVAQDSVPVLDATLPPKDQRIATNVLETAAARWKTKALTFDARVSQAVPSWRYVHDGGSLIVAPFFADGRTATRYQLVQVKSLADAIADIERRRLKMTDAQREDIDQLVLAYPADAAQEKRLP